MKPNAIVIVGNSYIFDEMTLPFIPELARHFQITILMQCEFLSQRLSNKLKKMKDQGIIEEIIFLPPLGVKFFLAMNKLRSFLREQSFELFLSCGYMHPIDLFVGKCVLPGDCKKVLFVWPGFRAMMYESVKDLPQTNELGSGEFTRKLQKLIRERRFFNRLLMGARNILYKLRNLWYNLILRRVYPKLFWRIDCSPGKYDVITDIGTSGFDHIIFFDNRVTEIHRQFYPGIPSSTVRSPVWGNCSCSDSNMSHKNKILCIMSGPSGVDKIMPEYVESFARDLLTVKAHVRAHVFHLRKHPRDDGKWPYQLQRLLQAKGVVAEVVEASQPVREIACDYSAVVGFLSAALLDARVACRYVKVVVFESVSKLTFYNPRLVMGDSDGIDWINEDGTFSEKTFEYKEYVPAIKEDFMECLLKIANKDPKIT